MKNVLMCYDAGNYASRCVIMGVQKFTTQKSDWNVRVLSFPEVLTADMVLRAPTEGYNGILLPLFTKSDVANAIAKTPLPVSFRKIDHILTPQRKKNVAVVSIDDIAVGAMGARHFLGLGKFNSYAFVPHADAPYWSEQRMDGFVKELKRHGIRATVLLGGGTPQEIADLPKPTAVMAAWDYKAIEVMGYARKQGFSIPEQVAVIGVDADPIVCGFSHPPLTSIEPDFERMGYVAAAALDAMMSGRKLNSVNRISCPPKGIVERASTYFLPTGQSLVDQARTIIKIEATRGLSVKALSVRLKISPQLLALRFRQFGGTTPQNLILQTRLEHAKRLMKNPKIKLDAIAEQCGFSSKNRLFHVFKERFGMTICEFRAQA